MSSFELDSIRDKLRMKITWYGTASISIKTEHSGVLFDPFVPIKGSTVKIDRCSYACYKNIVITHAHLDHVSSLPEIYADFPREIYGTKAVKNALLSLRIPLKSIHLIEPNSKMSFGDIKVTAYRSKHIKFDKKTIFQTLVNSRMLRYSYNLFSLIRINKICQERNEVLGYMIECEEKQIFLLGSLSLDLNTFYPQNMDLLILPYQGTSNLLIPGMAIIERLNPKAILLDHFDDTFPPVSKTIKTDDIEEALRNRIPVYKPTYGSSVDL